MPSLSVSLSLFSFPLYSSLSLSLLSIFYLLFSPLFALRFSFDKVIFNRIFCDMETVFELKLMLPLFLVSLCSPCLIFRRGKSATLGHSTPLPPPPLSSISLCCLHPSSFPSCCTSMAIYIVRLIHSRIWDCASKLLFVYLMICCVCVCVYV